MRQERWRRSLPEMPDDDASIRRGCGISWSKSRTVQRSSVGPAKTGWICPMAGTAPCCVSLDGDPLKRLQISRTTRPYPYRARARSSRTSSSSAWAMAMQSMDRSRLTIFFRCRCPSGQARGQYCLFARRLLRAGGGFQRTNRVFTHRARRAHLVERKGRGRSTMRGPFAWPSIGLIDPATDAPLVRVAHGGGRSGVSRLRFDPVWCQEYPGAQSRCGG